MLHVPHSCRLRMINVVAQYWSGLAQGKNELAQDEEDRRPPPLVLGAHSIWRVGRGSKATHPLGGTLV